jgi:hypothetical protein
LKSATFTISHTIADHPDRVLLVFPSVAKSSSGIDINNMDFNGDVMTMLFKDAFSGTYNHKVGAYILLNPDVGTHNITINSTASQEVAVVVIDYYGVNQDNPVLGLEHGVVTNDASPSTTITVDGVLSSSRVIGLIGVLNSATNPSPVAPLAEVGTILNATYNIRTEVSEIAAGGGSDAQWTWPSGNLYYVNAAFELLSNSGGEHVSSGKTAGAHKYKVSIIDASGETDPSPASSILTNDATYLYNIVRRPAVTVGMTGWKVYGTKAGGEDYFLLGEMTVNDEIFTDSYPDDEYGSIPPQIVNTTSGRPQIPRQQYIPAVALRSTATKTNTVEAGNIKSEIIAANSYNGVSQETGLWLAGGTYTMIVHGYKGVDRGLIDWYIDEVKVVSLQDWYAAAGAVGSFETNNIVIVGDGYHKLRAVVNGKNVSSSNFATSLYSITLFSTTF